jgi:hypothetical protein
MSHKKKKKVKKCHVLGCCMFSFGYEGFSCGLNALHGDPTMKIMHFLSKLLNF